MAPTKHSPFSPSASEIYFNCPGSIASQAEAGDTPTKRSAKDGQRAHFLGETSLRERKPPRDFLFETLRNPDNGDSFHVTETMVDAVEQYYDFVMGILAQNPKAEIMIEVRLEATIAGEKIYGTCDCLIIAGSEIHIVDYKNGSHHEVEAEGNKQLLIYAILAAETLGEFTGFNFAIVQPNTGGDPKTWYQNAAELARFKTELEEAILATLENPDELKPGDHCLWCKAKPKCGAFATSAAQCLGTRNGVVILPTADSLNDADLAAYIHKMTRFMATVRSSLKTAEALATERIRQGRQLDQLELKAARGSRDWKDQKAVIDHFGDAAFSKEVKSPAQIEKTLKVPKGELDRLGFLVTKEGAVTLHRTWEQDNFEDLT